MAISSASDPPVPHAPPGPSSGSPLTLRGLRCWLTTYRRTWRSSFLSSAFGPMFYLGAIGFGLGKLVNSHGTSAIGGVSYVAFVAPGILCMQAMNKGMRESTFPVSGALRWTSTYISAQATPLRPAHIFRGHLMFMTGRVALNSLMYLMFMAVFGAVHSWEVIFSYLVAVLTGLAFAAPIAAWAVTLKVDTAFNYMYRIVMVPLMMFSGTYYPVALLPGWLRPVVYASPLWQGVDLARPLSLGHSLRLTTAAGHVAYLLVLVVVGVWAGGRTYKRRLYV
jgi:lipooligosaccharide transport system permease protein